MDLFVFARKKFIKNCINFDTPRLQTEEYPSSVSVESDIEYGKHVLDIYKSESVKEGCEEAFFLIHGGAFVYGSKELDKRFGMYLSIESGLPVVNVNYTLMPEGDLHDVLTELFQAVDFVATNYGFKKLHYIGDSAGGYLAFIMSCLTMSKEAREEMKLPSDIKVTVGSVNPVCGCYKNKKFGFPGAYFEKKTKLPEYIYNLFDLVKKTGSPSVAIVTGDQDFLRQENRDLKKYLDELGIPAQFIDATSTEDEQAFHVFPIAQPTKPQAMESIRMFSKNAIG